MRESNPPDVLFPKQAAHHEPDPRLVPDQRFERCSSSFKARLSCR